MSHTKGEHGSCPTVRIVAPITDDNPHGYVLINASDFDADRHERYEQADGAGHKAETASQKKAREKKEKDEAEKAKQADGAGHKAE